MSLNEYTPKLLATLGCYRAFNSTEAEYLRQLSNFLKTSGEPFAAQNFEGHITASGVLVDDTLSSVLMIWHSKLHRWLQPGGHCDPQLDISPDGSALRELVEETGITPASVRLVIDMPLDIDVHLIPARPQEPEHPHYDLRYLYRLRAPTICTPARWKWVAIIDAAGWQDQSISRFATKLLRYRRW